MDLREELRKELKVAFKEYLKNNDEKILDRKVGLLLLRWDKYIEDIIKIIDIENLNDFIRECFYERAISIVKVKHVGNSKYFAENTNKMLLNSKLMTVNDEEDKSKLKMVTYILNKYYEKVNG